MTENSHVPLYVETTAPYVIQIFMRTTDQCSIQCNTGNLLVIEKYYNL